MRTIVFDLLFQTKLVLTKQCFSAAAVTKTIILTVKCMEFSPQNDHNSYSMLFGREQDHAFLSPQCKTQDVFLTLRALLNV